MGAAALVLTTISGSTYNAFAYPLMDVLSPLSLLFLSEMLMGFFVLLSFGAVPSFRAVYKLRRKFWAPLLAVGLLSSVLGPFFWFIGLKYSGAVNASLVGKVDIMIMLGLAHVFLGEKLTKAHGVAVALVLSGLLLVSYQDVMAGMALRPSDLIIVLSVVCYACGGIVFRKYLHGVEAHVALLVRSLVAVTVFFLLSPFLHHTFIEEVGSLRGDLLLPLIGFGFVSRFLNVFLYYQAVDRLQVSTVSIFVTLDIIGSMLFAYWLLGEQLEWYHMAGGLCVILGNVYLEVFGVHAPDRHRVQHLKQRVSHRP